jgi:phage terminase large subunit
MKLPNDWPPRPHQQRLWKYLEAGGKRAVAVWHRRAGKDSTAINWTAAAAHQRVGTYWHMLPTASQGRLVAWEGRDGKGRRVIDQAFPRRLRSGIRHDRMSMELKNGSVWQVVGSDNYDRLVGANPVGVVFSEWSLTDPRAWDYVRPILAENGGWAVFIYTPRGRNHGFELNDMARHRGDWFAERLGVDATGVLEDEVIAAERASGMSEALIQQEYFCSFEAASEGSYYGKLLEQAEQAGRVTRVPWQPELKVDTWWDLGIGDSTAVWFSQQAGLERHFIDYYECSGEGLAHYAKMLQDKGYVYGEHRAPHDIAARELGTGRSRLEVAKGLGLNFRIAPRLSVEDGIEAVRNLLPRCWFDAENCRHGLKALRSYHREFNEQRQTFLPHPVHDWSSDAADAFRTGAVTLKDGRRSVPTSRRMRPRRGTSYMSL